MTQKIHMIGVCGVAMGTLALMLHERGHAVSGSDRNMYPPMSDVLAGSGVRLFEGFSADNIDSPDLVVIGNAVSRGNPEVEYVLNARLPYLSMAQALYAFFLRDKEVVAVAGTHGKTTTTALLAHLLEESGMSPSFFVGGVTRNYGANHRLGSGRYFVIEADEYDSAFFEKVPKFVLYRPAHLLLTSLEFDHADIYRDLAEIELWFGRLVNMLPSGGTLLYAADYANLRAIADRSLSRRFSYGSGGADFTCAFRGYEGDFSRLDIATPEGSFPVETSLFGNFNYANVLAAAAMARLLGAPEQGIARGISSFLGVKRRQERIYDAGGVKIYEDFAHHPTAVRYVLGTMRERFPGARLWALFEPRSATSRRNVFQDVLPGSFAAADVVLIRAPYEGSAVPDGGRLDAARLVHDISAIVPEARLFPDAGGMLDYIGRTISLERENVIVIMSNGAFDGIYDRIRVTMDALAGGRPLRPAATSPVYGGGRKGADD